MHRIVKLILTINLGTVILLTPDHRLLRWAGVGVTVALTVLFSLALTSSVALAGTVTIVDGPNVNTGTATINDAYIENQLSAGHFVVDTNGLGSGPDDIRVQAGAEIKWTSGFSLTLRADNDIVVTGTIQHDGPKSGVGGLQMIAQSGTVIIGTGEQENGVVAGSRFGLTQVRAIDLFVHGGNGIADSFAQLGYRADGGGANFSVTGPISVTVSGMISVTGGGGGGYYQIPDYAQIGHGGGNPYRSEENIIDGNFTGAIQVRAGIVSVLGGDGYQDAYAQIGNGGKYAFGNHGGDHVVEATSVTFKGGKGSGADAQLGNGDFDSYSYLSGEHDGSHTVRAVDVTFEGNNGYAYAYLGNRGNGVAGDHTVVAENVIFQKRAVLGNEGRSASGDHHVHAQSVTFFGRARMGNDGLGDALGSGNHTVEAGDVTFQGGSYDGSYVHFGNSAYGGEQSNAGNHEIVADNVVLLGGSGSAAYVYFGNRGEGIQTGDHLIDADRTTIQAGGGDYAYVQYGNGGPYADGNHSGQLHLHVTETLTVSAGGGFDAYAMIGHGSDFRRDMDENGTGTRTGDIHISAGDSAVFSATQVGHVTASGWPAVIRGDIFVGVSQNEPYPTGAGELLVSGVLTDATRFRSSTAGELRFYIPNRNSVQIPTDATFNDESFTSANTIPEDRIQGFYLFGDGPYENPYSFYLGGLPDVAVAKSVSPTVSLLPGQLLTYTLSFSNSGSAPATGVVISDPLPRELSAVTLFTGLDSDVVVTQTGDPPDLSWQVSDLGIGQGGQITITATVSDSFSLFGAVITNTATITSNGDRIPNNNSASVSSSVITQVTTIVTGTVLSDQGNGIEGASVILTDTLQSSFVSNPEFEASDTTDANGNFRIEDVPVGEYELIVTLPGEEKPVYSQTVAVGASPVTVIDPIVLSTQQGVYLPLIQR